MFEQKAEERRTETDTNYELVMKDLISHLFPPKALQHQKWYLRNELHKPRDTKIRYFICRIDKIVKYLKKFSPFGVGQRLPDDNIHEMVEFSLPKEWQKELIIQGFDSATQGLMELVEFCKRLETSEEIFQTHSKGNHQKKTKQSGERHQSAKLAKIKGSNQAANPSEEDANKKKTKNKNSPV